MNIPLKGDAFDGINNLLFNKMQFNIEDHLICKGSIYTDDWSGSIGVFDPLTNGTTKLDNYVTSPASLENATFSVQLFLV